MAGRIVAAAQGLGVGMASILLAGALSACSSGPAAGPSAAAVPQKWVDFPSVLADEDALKQTLPDPASMPGWKAHRKQVNQAVSQVSEEDGDDCPGCKLDGNADFEAGTAKASFKITTFTTAAEASSYLATSVKKYGKNASPLSVGMIGNETTAYSGTFGSSTGDLLLMRVGTTVAGVLVTGPSDVPKLQKMAIMLARRIEQTAAGQSASAALDTV
ncbi:hypothetical protein [Kitasatospora aureofaciens]|uniref:hypothetical protein n=1 Tax=Kitasatospora aureofaciens TaxID=1894 RepID=UPI0037C954CC